METKSLPQLNHKWFLTTILFVLILTGFNLQSLMAQQAGTYTFTTLTSQSLDGMSGSTQLIGDDVDDSPSSTVNIGFNFVFEGITYTQYGVSPDGFLKLGSGIVSQNSNNMTKPKKIQP